MFPVRRDGRWKGRGMGALAKGHARASCRTWCRHVGNILVKAKKKRSSKYGRSREEEARIGQGESKKKKAETEKKDERERKKARTRKEEGKEGLYVRKKQVRKKERRKSKKGRKEEMIEGITSMPRRSLFMLDGAEVGTSGRCARLGEKC